VEIRTVYPRTNGRISASVDFTVTVPAGTAVALKTVSGDITVTGVEGEVRVEAISGDVEVSGTPDVAVAKTVSGDVSARNIGSESGLSLGSVSGNIIATALKVRTLEAGTVSGDLVLSDLQVERLEAKSVSGNIQCTVALQRGGRYTFNSHSGDVRLAVGGDAGFELDASTFSGSIRSDFPITLRGEQERGRRVPRTIRGSFGDAGAILSIRSFSGTVVIEKG
jgi:DUF4097 and DUF4098 domain-containing protein YvlB